MGEWVEESGESILWHNVAADLSRLIEERRAEALAREDAERRHAALPLWRRVARRVRTVLREEIARSRKV